MNFRWRDSGISSSRRSSIPVRVTRCGAVLILYEKVNNQDGAADAKGTRDVRHLTMICAPSANTAAAVVVAVHTTSVLTASSAAASAAVSLLAHRRATITRAKWKPSTVASSTAPSLSWSGRTAPIMWTSTRGISHSALGRSFRGDFDAFTFGHRGPLKNTATFLHVEFGPSAMAMGVQRRLVHVSKSSLEAKPSSKIEETVQALKETQEEKKKEETKKKEDTVRKMAIADTTQAVSKAAPSETAVAPPKKSLWTRIVDELKHYYSGFKLLFLDVKVSSKIVWKVLQGNTLTRRENKQLVRTVSDLFRLVPFSVFVIVPFMEFLLPVALKLFPGMLPSTFTTSSERDTKMRRALKAKLEYAKFLQKTLDEMAPTSHDDRSSQNARDFVNFYNAVKDKGMQVTNEDIVKFSKLFEDEITLDNMERNQLVALCRLLELTPIGTSNFLRFQLEMKLRQLKSDDRVIQREGLQNLDVQELQNACKERGMRAYGHTADDLRRQLQQWLDLSLNANIPPSLLLLSRTLFLPEHIPATAQIAATISALPQSTATQTSAQIGEREGKVRNVVQLEVIKEEQRKIEAEAAEEAAKKARGVEEQKKKVKEQEKKVLEAAETAAAAIAASAKEAAAAMAVDPKAKPQPPQEAPTVETLIREITSPLTPLLQAEKAAAGKDGEELVDKAPVLSEISSEDLSDLKTAIESLGKSSDEAVEIDNLKKELQEYEEDVEELKTVKEQLERIDLKESKAAQRLFSKVNKMLNKVGGLVDHLEKKEKQITEVEMLEDRAKAEKKLVTVYELIDAVQKLQKTSDASRLEHIAAVLNRIDEDADGVLKVEHVMKVIELLGEENVKLSSKQMSHIIDMLEKEEMLEVESNIEKALHKSSQEDVEATKPGPGNAKTDSQTVTVSREEQGKK